MNKEFRQKLQEMTQELDVSKHPALLIGLSKTYPNSILILPSAHPIDRYTCLVHAFDFTEKKEYLEIATCGSGRIFASPAFALWLLQHNFLDELTQNEDSKGAIILYMDGKNIRHAGLVTRVDRVISKWGIGHLYEHEVFEVPESYGTEVRFFKKPPYNLMYNYLVAYAKENGLQYWGESL